MKTTVRSLIFIVILSILYIVFFPNPTFASTEVFGNISEDATWTVEEGPYIVHDSLVVDPGIVLTIDPGVIVKFDQGASLVIDGLLDVWGTSSDPVYFTSLSDDSVGGDTNDDEDATSPAASDWNAFIFNTGSVHGTLNHLISTYARVPLSVFDATIDSDGLNVDGEIALFSSKNNVFINTKSKYLRLYDASSASLSDSEITNDSKSRLVGVFDASSLSINNTRINSGGTSGYVVSAFDNSTLNIDGMTMNGLGDSPMRAIGLFNGVNFELRNSSMENISDAMYIDSSSNTIIDNVNIKCSGIGLTSYFSNVTIANTSINCSDTGIADYYSNISMSSLDIFGSTNHGLIVYDDPNNPMLVSLAKSEIHGNGVGIGSYGGVFVFHGNSIHSNTIGAESVYPGDLDFTKNWWGSATGPYHATLNVEGLGNSATDNISYYPWLKYDPIHPGVSNVLFIPGIQASRLYKQKHIPIIGDVEDKLWEPNTNSDVTDMLMDSLGISINPDIYTRDVIDTENVLGFGSTKIYDSFIDDMDTMVSSGVMSAWRAAPYDWRYSPEDVVNRGVVDTDGNISYTDSLAPEEESYMVRQLVDLINSSKSGRVTLVTHSNGGLVAKALMMKLEQMKADGLNDYIDNIDRVIMVAAPQIGTPKAIPALLHGYDQELAIGILLKQSIARLFGLHMPGGYGLLPTEKYFSTIKDSPIVFDKSLETLNPFFNLHKTYGDSITKYSDFVDFMLGQSDDRKQPGVSELSIPAVLTEGIFNNIKNFHESVDEYVFPDTVQVYQVAGWGLPTVRGVRYFARTDCVRIIAWSPCTKVKSMDVEPLVIDDGDNTVVSPSALNSKNAENYFLNLFKFNDDRDLSGDKAFNHSRIFDITYLRDFIKNILTNNKNIPDYITMTKPTNKKNLVLYVHLSPGVKKSVRIVDKGGLITGANPEQLIDVNSNNFVPYLNQIPGASYTFIGRSYYVYLPYSASGASSNYTLQITDIDSSTTQVVDSINDIQNPDDLTDPASQISGGEISIRIDTVTDGVIENSVNTSSIPVESGTSATVVVPETGIPVSVDVDIDSNGVVDSTVPFTPTPEPASPVQDESTPAVEDKQILDIQKSSKPSNRIVSTNIEKNEILDLPTAEAELAVKELAVPIAANIDPNIVRQIVSTRDVVLSSDSDQNLLTAQAGDSGTKIPWVKTLAIVTAVFAGSFVVLKIIYKVK